MNWIVAKKTLNINLVQLKISAPRIVEQWLPGQFVQIKITENSEKISVSISNVDKFKETIVVLVQHSGKKQNALAQLNIGDEIFSISELCGDPVEIANYGTVLCAAGAVGIAPIYPIIAAMRAAGNRVLVVVAAKNCEYIILENEIRQLAEHLEIMTDDGSCGIF